MAPPAINTQAQVQLVAFIAGSTTKVPLYADEDGNLCITIGGAGGNGSASVATGADAWRYARKATLSDDDDEADAPARGFQVLVDCTVRYVSRDTDDTTEVEITQTLTANSKVERAVYRVMSTTTSTSGANIVLGW